MLNPQHWIPIKWPKTISLNCCEFTDNIDPEICDTESLKIVDDSRFNKSGAIYINWEKFPNLKYLFLFVNDIDLTYINKCENLEIVLIDVDNRQQVGLVKNLPNTICELKKLKRLSSNCILQSKTHFKSKDLISCNVLTTQKITSCGPTTVPICTELYHEKYVDSNNLSYFSIVSPVF